MDREKFMNLVMPEPNTGCWIWIGRFDNNGYGRLSHREKYQVAHRYSFALFNGDFDVKEWVLHKCDNPFCVNPDHLYLGDAKQNMIDRDTRGRQKTQRGSAHKLAKISEADAIQIRALHNSKTYPTRKLARDFGISQCTVMKILKRVAWNHV